MPRRKPSARRGIVAAQVLLTLGDTEERRRYLNARATITTLLKLGAVPVINENDTVATDRNPLRRQRSAGRAGGHDDGRRLLVLLSDIDGLLHRAAWVDARREAIWPRSATSRPRSRRWPATRLRAVARRHGDQDRGGKIATAGGTHMVDRRAAR